MVLHLHNTLTRTKERFRPIDPRNVRMYVCGPTVYQRIHIGNARAFVVFDVLYRLLRHLYGDEHVTYVRNITDIDDKIIAEAQRTGEDIRAITDRTTAQFNEDLKALGCLPPTHQPRATEHVPGMIALAQRLIERGHAYAAEGHVLFHVPSMPEYGRLSGRNRDEQIAGARVDVAPYKRDPADFVLWKPSADDQPGWDSPWGRGRPGWHIECSAMSEALLGVPFDIHAGGLDLIFPHHENEIAQTCCAHGLDRMANYWLHNGFLDMRGEKMSKSVGNVIRVPDALQIAPPEAIRLLLLGTHYRQPANFTEEGLVRAKRILDRLYVSLGSTQKNLQSVPPRSEFISALCDDLNTPKAISALMGSHTNIVTSLGDQEDGDWSDYHTAELLASAKLLGLLNVDPEIWLRGNVNRERIEKLIQERAVAREIKDYATADEIRRLLESEGFILEDTSSGTTWRRA